MRTLHQWVLCPRSDLVGDTVPIACASRTTCDPRSRVEFNLRSKVEGVALASLGYLLCTVELSAPVILQCSIPYVKKSLYPKQSVSFLYPVSRSF